MSDIDNITINFDDSIDNIEIDYLSTINNIQLTLGEAISSGAANVTSVDGMTGNIILSLQEILGEPDIINGQYVHNVEHNFSTMAPTVTLYDPFDREVFASTQAVDNNNVRIIGAINLIGYRAVVRR